MSVEELKREVQRLPDNERGELIAALMATFNPPDEGVSDEEVARRVAETESGKVEDISFEQLEARIQDERH